MGGTSHPDWLDIGRAALVQLSPALVAGACFIAMWEVAAQASEIPETIFPAASQVARQILEHRQALFENAVPTLAATVSGFAVAASVAFLFSVMALLWPVLGRAIVPLLIVSQTIPLVAMAPLVVLWFGFGLLPKVLLVALVTFFPMLQALMSGYASLDEEIIQLLRSMGASKWTVFLKGHLPASLPYFFAGLRTSVSYAVVAAIFAEHAGAAKGLGVYIIGAKNSFRADLVLAAVVVGSLLTLALYGLAMALQASAMPWRRTTSRGEA